MTNAACGFLGFKLTHLSQSAFVSVTPEGLVKVVPPAAD